MAYGHDYYKGDARYPGDAPHYVLTTASDWRSEPFKTRAAAQSWLEGMGVTDTYKQEHYSIVSVTEFWDRRHGNRPLRWA